MVKHKLAATGPILIRYSGLLLLWFASPAVALAQEKDVAPEHAQGLYTVDWLLIGLYAIGTLILGWYYGRKQKSTSEYFVGSGHMNPLLIGVSLFATLLSTISYLSMPGEALGKGPVFMATWLAFPLTYLVVGYVLLPVYMQQHVTSAYELLEKKLGLSVRLLGATMFVVLRLVWMSLLIYLTANAMTTMLGVDKDWIPAIVLFTGFVSVVYTSMGGLRAVVITDFLQTMLMLGGAWLVILTVTWHFGGFDWFPTTWQDNWDTQPFFSFDPSTRVTFVGSIAMFFVWSLSTTGGDQTTMQRFMATKDAKTARRALGIQMIVSVVIGLTLGLVGFALLGYSQSVPESLPVDWTLKNNADDIFPRFIAYQLPIGVSGLVVSAMFAAAMSSIDSGVNSITAVVMRDYLDRFGLQPNTERGHVMVAKILAFSIGAVIVVGSSFMGNVPGNISAVTAKTTNLLATPIFALFIFALFVRFSNAPGVWIATIVGVVTAIVIAFSGPIVTWLALNWDVQPENFGVSLEWRTDPETQTRYQMAPDPISFQWIGPIALTVNLLVGLVACWLLQKPTKDQVESASNVPPQSQ